MKEKYGVLQRAARKAAGKTMGDLAERIGFSVSYVSDVERGYRMPWSDHHILIMADFLGVDPAPLLAAAAAARGAFVLNANVSQYGREAGASLMRAWGDLTDEDFKELDKIAQKRMKSGGEA